MRLKGKMISKLEKKDEQTSSFEIEVELPTGKILKEDFIPGGPPNWGNDKRTGRSRFIYIPNEITIYFHDDPNDEDFLSQLTRGQLKNILTQARDEGRLSDDVILKYEGGCSDFTEEEREIIRSYLKPSTPLLEVKNKTKAKRMLRVEGE